MSFTPCQIPVSKNRHFNFGCAIVWMLAILSLDLKGQNIVTPKAGIPIFAEVRSRLANEITALRSLSGKVRQQLQQDRKDLLRFMPDAEVFHVSVGRTLEDEIFYHQREFDQAEKQLAEGRKRLALLQKYQTPWNTQTGLVIRAYRSKIDGSLQPYGLWLPPTYARDGRHRRLDVWFHGRSDKLSEVAFLGRRMSRPEQFAPADTIVLSPYGRFCNAMKFAGEVDTWEALEHVKQFYDIDDNRISVRGFSMGGAASWHFGAHHASSWVSVNPGAGFVETKIYQKLVPELNEIPWYQQKLWRLCDALDYAVNLENTSLIAYSGELDKQKEAADLMAAALSKEGIKMTHIIGPKVAHKYEPKARETVAKLVDSAAMRGRSLSPAKIRFTTATLKYNRMHWVTVDGLERHWDFARVEAELGSGVITATMKNVTGITFAPKDIRGALQKVILDGQELPAPRAYHLGGWSVSYVKEAGKWRQGTPSGLRKRHDLQGPIDDAFMDGFLFVKPTGSGWNPQTDQWVAGELADAKFQWRRQMRGNALVKSSADVTAADIADRNLILWGDPASNPLIERIVSQLPVKWTKRKVILAGKSFDSTGTVPVMIYPNPLNPDRYVVLNSGQTFMQFGAMSNSRQTPKLPDWALLDTSVRVQDRVRKKGVRAAGFFDEQWQ
jgi:dienelactone hydrolase